MGYSERREEDGCPYPSWKEAAWIAAAVMGLGLVVFSPLGLPLAVCKGGLSSRRLPLATLVNVTDGPPRVASSFFLEFLRLPLS